MINSFSGEYRFLSNFYPCRIKFEGIEYPSTEHAYQAAKTLDIEDRRKIAGMKSAGEAKRYGKKVKLRNDWHSVSLQIMEDFNYCKFANSPTLKKWLLDTNDEELVEGNTWNDTFWGVCEGIGLNHLGKILMRVRQQLREG